MKISKIKINGEDNDFRVDLFYRSQSIPVFSYFCTSIQEVNCFIDDVKNKKIDLKKIKSCSDTYMML